MSAGPWSYFASKKKQDAGSWSSAVFALTVACFGSLLLLILSLLGKTEEVLILSFESTMVVAWILHLTLMTQRLIKPGSWHRLDPVLDEEIIDDLEFSETIEETERFLRS